MEINISHGLRLESALPLLSVEDFCYEWMPNRHAVLEVNGYIAPEIPYGVAAVCDSRIRIWREEGNETLFHGYVVRVSEESAGETRRVHIEAQSASCMLDRQLRRRSFQAVGNTYAQVVREAVEDQNGQIVCTEGNGTSIGKPVIQYDETVWAFTGRLAGRLGTCVIADIISGEPALWFGMRGGNTIPAFREEEYDVSVARTVHGDGRQTETVFETGSRDFYQIGDKTVFCGRQLVICGVSACFGHGELTFRYQLKDRESCRELFQESFTGLGLSGTVTAVRNEQVKVALDIDGGRETGDYYYDWYPVTGNALYAMPETGARVEVCFGSRDEREGFGLDSFLGSSDQNSPYQHRRLYAANGNFAHLFDSSIEFADGGQYDLCINDGSISLDHVRNPSISAGGAVQLKAAGITVNALDELSFYYG